MNIVIKEGFGFSDKFAQINHLCLSIAVIEFKRATCLQCHTTRTSQAFTTTQLLGVNNRAAFEFGNTCIVTLFAVGFQSVTPSA
jgi:hypothetical protein